MTTDLGHGRGWAADDCAASIFRIDAQLGRPLQITQAGRTVAENNAMIARWDAGNRAGLVTRPSTTSHHLTGEAIDSNDQTWLNTNGTPHGFLHDVPGDSVHYDYYVSHDTFVRGSAPVVATIRAYQTRLNVWAAVDGAAQLAADGVRGPLTIARTKDFQAKHGLTVDGIVGPITTAALALAPATPAPVLVPAPTPAPAPAPAPAPVPTPTPEKLPMTPAPSKSTAPTKAELDAAVDQLKAVGVNVNAGLPGGVLAGLFTNHVSARRRSYFGYSIAALLVSFGPDIALAGFLTGHELNVFTASMVLASSVLLKVGTAFGFIAASNTK